ncbi:MAG TPA: tetratricopeptide repeat protein [Stenomitos sp.]
MKFCINPWCQSRVNQEESESCLNCDSPLLVGGRFKIIRPIFDIHRLHPTDIYEVIDTKGSWISPPNSLKILKVLKAFDPDGTYRKMLQREAEILQLFDSPAIPRVDIDDFFSISLTNGPDELWCLAIAKLEGITLDCWLRENDPIDQSLAIEWLSQMADILTLIHGQGIIHRDIKPTNILVTPNRSLALLDFGGARITTDTYYAKLAGGSGGSLTQIYSLGYTAPEQMNGRGLPQSDFYSLGRTFINVLTGKDFNEIPRDEDSGTLLWQPLAKQIDQPLRQFIETLASPVVGKRPNSAAEISSFLQDVLPIRLRRNRLWKSKLVRSGAFIALGTLIWGSGQWIKTTLANHYREMGEMQVRQSNWPSARSNFEKALKLERTSDTLNNLGYTCAQQQDRECAVENYTEAIRKGPEGYSAYFNLGALYEDEGNFTAAKTIYEKAIQASKGKAAEPLNNLSRLYLIQRDAQQAKVLAGKALKLTSVRENSYAKAVILKNLGWSYLIQKKYDLAQNMLNQSIKLYPNLASSHCLLAQTLEAQSTNAWKEWRFCVSIQSEDAGNPEVLEWRQGLVNRLSIRDK